MHIKERSATHACLAVTPHSPLTLATRTIAAGLKRDARCVFFYFTHCVRKLFEMPRYGGQWHSGWCTASSDYALPLTATATPKVCLIIDHRCQPLRWRCTTKHQHEFIQVKRWYNANRHLASSLTSMCNKHSATSVRYVLRSCYTISCDGEINRVGFFSCFVFLSWGSR